MEFLLKGLKVKVDFILRKEKRGWSIKFKSPDTFLFYSNRIWRDDEIILEMSKHYRFIKRCLNQEEKIYSNSIHLFGKEYELIKEYSDIRRMVLFGDKVYLYTDTEDKNINQQIANQFYYENLSYFVNNHIEKAKQDMGIKFPITIQYKQVKTYYGECLPKRRIVIFQLALAKYDEISILSVIYHELCHFYYQNHQSSFYKRLEEVFPSYREIQARLRRTKYNDAY